MNEKYAYYSQIILFLERPFSPGQAFASRPPSCQSACGKLPQSAIAIAPLNFPNLPGWLV